MKCEKCEAEFFSVAGSPVTFCSRCLVQGAMGKLLEDDETLPMEGTSPDRRNWGAYAHREDLEPVFPEFELLDRLGAGGMGAVFKARQKSLDRMVAIKILNPKLAEEPEFQERFEREAKAMAMLSHPNIVGVHDFGVREGFHYLVMEYVDGCDLHKLIRAGEVDEKLAFSVITQTCEALHFAHENGVVHRDVKPGNIFVGKNGVAKIGDFGIARIVDLNVDASLTMTGVGMGTPSYMAPEQLTDAKMIDARADVYALGVVIYQMLTGNMPTGNFPPPTSRLPHRNKRLDQAVLRAMESDPDERMSDVKDISRALGKIGGNQKLNKEKAKAGILSPIFIVVLLVLALGGGWVGWSIWKPAAGLPLRTTPSTANDSDQVSNSSPEKVPIEMLLPRVGTGINKEFEAARRRGGILRKWESHEGALDISAADGVYNLVSLNRTRGAHSGWFGARANGEMLASNVLWNRRSDYLDVTESFWIERPNRLVSVKKSDTAFIPLPEGVNHAIDLASSHHWGSLIITPEGRVVIAAPDSWRKANLPIVTRVEALEGAVSVDGLHPILSILTREGEVLSWNNEGVFLDPPKGHRPYIQASPGAAHVIALRDDGIVETWSSPMFSQGPSVRSVLQIPEDLGPVIRVLASGFVSAAQRPDGSWVAWGSDQGMGLIDAINSTGPALDLYFRYSISSRSGAKFLWIEPADQNGENASREALLPPALPGISADYDAIRRRGGVLRVWEEKSGDIDMTPADGLNDLVSVDRPPLAGGNWSATRVGGKMVSTVPSLHERSDLRLVEYSFSIEWPDRLISVDEKNHFYLPLMSPVERAVDVAQRGEVAFIVTSEGRVVLAADDSWIKDHQYVINPVKTLENVVSAVAYGRLVALHTSDGKAICWHSDFGFFDPPKDERKLVQLAVGMRHVTGLYEDGSVATWWHSKDTNNPRIGDDQVPPKDMGPVIRVESADFFSVAQHPDGSWTAWGNDDGAGLVDQINSIGVALDMEFYFLIVGNKGAKIVWIEPASPGKEKNSQKISSEEKSSR